MAIYPSGTPSNADLYVALDNFSTTLNGAIDAVQTTITLTSTLGLPTVGILTIESEKVHYTNIAGNDITGVTRGFSATSAAIHADGTFVAFNVVEEHHNANKDEIIAIATDLRDALIADLDDTISPATLAATISIRLNHIATKLKEINTGSDWKDAVSIPLTGLVALNGSRSFTANQPMGGFKLTGLAAGTTAGDSLRYEQVVGVYALDSAVIHLAGSETITGSKTFSLQSIHSSGIQTGSTIVSDTNNTDDLGTSGINWKDVHAKRLLSSTGLTLEPAINTDLVLNATGTGLVTSPASIKTTSNGVGGSLVTFHSEGDVAGQLTILLDNLSTGTGAAARFFARTAGTGDALIDLRLDVTKRISIGLDNSDSDALVFSESALGTSNILRIPTGGQVQHIDGTATAPAISFMTDDDLGIFKAGTNILAISTGGNKTVDFATGTATDGVDQDTMRFYAGSIGLQSTIRNRSTANVTTSAVKIADINQFCNLVLVTGVEGGNVFGDLVFTAFAVGTPVVVASRTSGASARTYTQSTDELRVAMGSGTYDITSLVIEQRTASF